ncbi:CHAT domain-containing protein [Fulvivirga sp. M361]|uniref:CHAT domain-containing protein n=1 Tax=Fulvivirga sp. M361 TaxID=2594266 RepID=UPI0016233408|nr:CHAT domain-containing protein [Fulvivirga sp. M361]
MQYNYMRYLCFSLFILLSVPTAAQEGGKYGKILLKADAQYEIGAYVKASKYLEKYKKKVIKKYGARNEYLPLFYIRRSKFNLAEGLLIDFENSIEQAITASSAIYGEASKEHAITLLDIGEILAHYGDYLRAEEYIRSAQKTLEASKALDDRLKAKSDLTLARVLTGRGFYNQALSFIDENLDYFKSRAVSKESFVDDKGRLQSKRLPEEEVNERLGDYAELLTLHGNVFRKRGSYKEADAAFKLARTWIDKNLGNASLAYVQNQLDFGQFLLENGLRDFSSDDVKNERFDKTLNHLKKKHEESHFLAFELYEQLLKYYLKTDSKSKYKNLKIEYEKAIKKNFKRNSIHYINLETIEFDAKLDKEKTNNLASKAAVQANSNALPKYHKKRIQILDFLYRLALQEKNYNAASANLNDILEIKKELYGDDSPEYHLARIELASYYVDFSDKIKEAEAIYSESFEGIVEPQIDTWHKDYVSIQNHLAKFYASTDQYALAIAAIDKASDGAAVKFSSVDPAYGEVLNNQAQLYLSLANYDKAEESLNKSLAIFKEYRRDENWVIEYINTQATQAQLKVIQGLFDEAEDIMNRSKKTLKRVNNPSNYNDLASSQGLARVYMPLGRFREANELLDRIIVEYQLRYGSSSRRLILPLVYRGQLELTEGEYTFAEKTARRANQIATSIYGENSSKVAPTLSLLADIYTSIGDYPKAQDNIEKAIRIQEAQFGRQHVDVAKSLAQLGLIKFYQGDNLTSAEKIIEEAKDIIAAKLGNRNPTYADALTDLAKIYISEKRFDDAFNALTLAETIWLSKAGKRNNINAASIYSLIGDIHYLQRDYDKAEEEYEKSKKIYQNKFSKNHPEYVKILSKLSKVYYMEGDTKKSRNYIEEALANHQNFIRAFFPALSEREKAKFWNTIRPDYEFYNTLAFKIAAEDKRAIGDVYNNALLTKAILLNSSIKIRERIANSNDDELKEKYNDWLAKKEELTNVLSMSLQQLQENEIDPIVLTHEVEQIEKELSQKSELFSQSVEDNTIVWNQVQEKLEPNEVAMEMVRYRYFDHVLTDSVIYAAMYLKNKKEQSTPGVVLLGDGKNMENKLFKFYRNSIIYRIKDPYSFDAYWEPIMSALGTYSTLYLSADGVYNQINLEAIPMEDGKYVIDNSNIVLVSNTKDIWTRSTRTRLVQNEKKASMFGNPEFYLTASTGDINPLPGTQVEVQELKDLLRTRGWDTSSYTDISASEDEIKRLNNPKVFHIATHGFFTPAEQMTESDRLVQSESSAARNPLLRTGLLLTGAGDLLQKTEFNYNAESGILTAYEAMNLNLDQTELVVLSACETGLGELAVGEGVYGLQRAFLVAGAKVLIMSMFKVDDVATQKLMSKFYKKWLETGKMRESFILAKKELRNEYQDPIFWGSFIMIGMD